MILSEVQPFKDALSKFGAKVKAVKQDSKGEVWKITLPFVGYNLEEFRFYVFQALGKKTFYLSDGGALLKSIRACGDPQMTALQGLLKTFGLSLMEDLSVMDSTTRPIPSRIMSFLQAWCAVDGVIRIWKVKQEEVSKALRPPVR